MVKMVTHTGTRSFEISKLKNLLEKITNPPKVTEVCDPTKSRTGRHRNVKLGL